MRMKLKSASVFRKSLREQLRDPWSLILTLLIGPLFVLLYWAFFGGASTTYSVLVLDEDVGVAQADGTFARVGEDVVRALRSLENAGGDAMLRVTTVESRADAEERLRNRDAAALIVLPADLSQAVRTAAEAEQAGGISVGLVGDLTNPQYTVAAILASSAADACIADATGLKPVVRWTEESLGSSGNRSEFELYVPGVLMVAVAMLVFQASMTVVREVEAGTLRRLMLTRMTSFDLLAGVAGTQVLIGVLAMLLGFATAVALGFHSEGPLGVAVLVAGVTTLAVVGVGLVVACFARSVSQAFIVANFPLILLMFFSGAVYPLPKLTLLTIAGRDIGAFDWLPLTHAVVALGKVLTLGAGFGDVLFELVAVSALSVVYFAAGVWLFKRQHLRAG